MVGLDGWGSKRSSFRPVQADMLRSEDDILNESEEDELSDEVRLFFFPCVFFAGGSGCFFLVFCLFLDIYFKDKESIKNQLQCI